LSNAAFRHTYQIRHDIRINSKNGRGFKLLRQLEKASFIYFKNL